MREGVGLLLAELMRIKAEGDYAAIKTLVDKYGVHFDPKLRDQVVARYKKLEPADLLGRRQREADVGAGPAEERAGDHHQLSARRGPPIPGLRRDVRRRASKGGREMSAPATSHVDTRPYLLERVDEAAVVQLYADGFTALPLREKILIYHLYQAAIAGRDIYYDQRYAHNLAMRDVLEEILTHADGIAAGDARRDSPLHQAVLDQHRPLQQPDGAQVRPEVHARGASGRGRGSPSATARASSPICRVAASVLLRPRRRSHRHQQDAGAGEGHPAGERQQPVRGRDDGGPRRLRGALSAQLAAGQAGRHGWSRRSTGSADATTSTSARSSVTSRRRFPTRPIRWRPRCAR